MILAFWLVFSKLFLYKITIIKATMKKFLLFFLLSFLAISCSNRVVDVKSPCVSGKQGPCGPKKPINDWWLKDLKQIS